ncbi:MAG: ABC1 kinase family protein [Candidatus Bipolaricaulia bacterium]
MIPFRGWDDGKRIGEITRIFIKHGFGYLVRDLLMRRDGHEAPPKRFRRILEELGPTFIKFGQAVSTRPDLFPPRVCEELDKLQDKVTPFASEFAVEIIEAELGRPLSRTFRHFDEQPVAAASLAQVHRATLRSGEEVAVKVRRPGIEAKIRQDIRLLYRMAGVLERGLAVASRAQLVKAVKEFEKNTILELDFSLEAGNAERLRWVFLNDSRVKIPKVHYATERVLCLEWLDGIKVNRKQALQAAGYDLKAIAWLIAEVYLDQILKFGIFHADPHPGNILVLGKNRLGLVDLGLVGELRLRDREHLETLFVSAVNHDADGVLKVLQAMEIVRPEDTERLHGEIAYFLEHYYRHQMKEIPIGRLMYELINRVLRHYQLDPPVRFLLLPKTLVTVEAVAEDLDPDYRWDQVIRSFYWKLHPGKGLTALFDLIYDQVKGLIELPGRLDRLSRRIEALEDGVSSVGTRRWQGRQTVRSVPTVGALTAVAVMISSALLVLGDPPPPWETVGLAGFSLGGLMGLVYTVFRFGG